jgi:putative ABC transport system permease protein
MQLAQVSGFESHTGGAVRRTGQAFLVSLPADYPGMFPAVIRNLIGAHSGVLLPQQTAANLAAAPGDTVDVLGAGGRTVTVMVDGVVDLPQADSFFQVVGAPPGAGATAPPDNVLLVPPERFDGLSAGSPPIEQLHVKLDHTSLPHDPSDAATEVDGRDNHLQAALAGGALVGDNLATALSGATEDARYAELLFLLLGVPGSCSPGSSRH